MSLPSVIGASSAARRTARRYGDAAVAGERRSCHPCTTRSRTMRSRSKNDFESSTQSVRNGKTLRMSLGLVKGGAIKIDPDEDVAQGLYIGEGVETCLAGRQAGYAPAWSVISAAGVAAFPVLPGAEALTVFGETDAANARAIEACRARWVDAGREVIVTHLIGSDLNDVRGRTAS